MEDYMKILKIFIRYSLVAGLLIFAIFKIMDRYMVIGDAIAIPVFLVSVILMLIGVAYNGWCFGKGKNPYKS
jgi:hypothetical protein